METAIFDEDLLSGVELLPLTEPSTPSNLKTCETETENLQRYGSKNSSPVKSSNLLTPTKMSSSVSSFNEKALEVQKVLQSSLTMSLRKEAEMKTKWQASPGEVFVKGLSKNRLNFSDQSSISQCNVPTKLEFLTIPPEENKLPPQKCAMPISPVKQPGPNICLANKFPSGISPIKSHSMERANESTLLEYFPDEKLLDEDPSTQKLIKFMEKLGQGPVNDITLAERMNQLSFLLKNSSLNSETKSDSEETCALQHPNHNLKNEMEPQKEHAVLQPLKASTEGNKKMIAQTKKTTGQNKLQKPDSNSNLLKKEKAYSTVSSTVPCHRSVHFANSNKQDRKKNDTKHSLKRKKNKDLSSSDTAPLTSTKQQSARGESIKTKIELSPSKPVQDMKAVRDHLQTMLNLHKVNPLALDITAPDSHVSLHESNEEDTFRSTDTATLLKVKPSDLLTLNSSKTHATDMTDSLTAEVFTMLKANKQPNSARSSMDSSVAVENEILRDSLEKEIYRRKHCEKQIQKLQKRVLDIQQELAVAHSTERKKDLMIEQLDKTLAKVVDGWKAHEANLIKSVGELTSEKEKGKAEVVKLKEMVVSLENELAKALEDLVEEKEHILKLEENDKMIQQSYQKRAEEISQIIDQKNALSQKLQMKIDDLKEENSEMQKKIKKLAQDLEDEKMIFKGKESQWEEAVNDIEKRQKDLLERERELTQQERTRCSNLQSSLSSTEQEMTRLQGLLEAQRGELASLRTQLDVMETKHQADLQKLGAEHKMDVERQVLDKLANVHEESQLNESRIRESHKKQVMELIAGHKRELEAQCYRYEDELQKKDEATRRIISEHEIAMNEKLKLKSDDMRAQMLNKMQNLLQTHYNETLQIVGNTTDVTPQRIPFPVVSLHQSTEPTLSFKTTVTAPKEFQSIQSTSAYKSDDATLIKPIPTLPSTVRSSAFSLGNSLSPPQITSFQPLYNSVSSYRSLPSALPLLAENPSTETENHNSIPDIEEGLPNLSLISSISHGQISSLPPPKEVYSSSHLTASNKADNHILITENHFSDEKKNGTLPLVSTDDSNSKSLEDFRQMHLQHYVQMLLQRSPGDPINTSSEARSPNKKMHDHKDDDNKENVGNKITVPMTSHFQPTFAQSTNQSKQAADLIFVESQTRNLTRDKEANPNNFIEHKKPNPAIDLKKEKLNVRFAQDGLKTESQQIPNQNVTSSDQTSLYQNTFLSAAQVGEITQLLDLYSNVNTPSGETRLAAEQLLRYLRDNNTSTTSKGSLHPSVTLSPLKRTNKQISKPVEGRILSTKPIPAGTKQRSKIGASPGKNNPVWR